MAIYSCSVVGYLAEPDQMLPWELISQVRIITTSPAACPICLSPPDAARITKCGHTYCLPCLLHLFALAQHIWEACPVCGELVKLANAKPVVSLKRREFRVGEMVNLVKVCRPVSLNYPLPCYLGREGGRDLLSSSDKGVQFSKLIAGDTNFRRQLLLRDRKELARSLKDSLCDVTFVHRSIESIDKELEGMTSQKDVCSDSATNLCQEISQDQLVAELDSSGEFSEEDIPPLTSLSTLSSEEHVFFYQAADGQYTFLDPLNTAMLREEYGSLARCPDRIRVRVVNIAHHLVSEQLRHRHKWMSHLPLMCEIQLVEVSIRAPLVSHYVLDCFKDTIEKRRLNRQIKQKEEEKSERKAAAYWSKAYPGLEGANPDSIESLPDFSMESFTPLPTSIAPEVSTANDTIESALYSSFAHVLSHPNQHPTAPEVHPVPDSPPQLLENSGSEDEFAPPTYRNSMGDAIATKLDAYLMQKDLEAVPKSKIPGRMPRGKKGRGKKVVLFSTSAARPN